jgi:hypothetical protein
MCTYSNKTLAQHPDATPCSAPPPSLSQGTIEQRLALIEARIQNLTEAASPSSSSGAHGRIQVIEDFYERTRPRPPVTGLPITGRHDTLQASRTSSSNFITIGTKSIPFPMPASYDIYLEFFFADINPCHSCINEADFRSKARKLTSSRAIGGADIWFLALNYIIFACADILKETDTQSQGTRSPGWSWYQIADDLIGTRKMGGAGDIQLIQFLIYEAFYLMHADKPNAAYNTIGLACRRCFQLGLHQSPRDNLCTEAYMLHIRQRILWTVYFVDRRISLSCGKPYGMRDADISIQLPQFLDDANVHPDQPLPATDPAASSIPYLHSTTAFSKLAGEVWDRLFAAGAPQPDEEVVVVLDAKIKHWLDSTYPHLQLLPSRSPSTRRHLRQHTLIVTRFNHLRLLLRRRTMVSLEYDGVTGRLCGELASRIVDQISLHKDEVAEASSFRFHMAVSLGGAVLVLATLMIRDLSSIALQDARASFRSAFENGVAMLNQLSQCLTLAKRIADDLKPITGVATVMQSDSMPFARTNDAFDNLDELLPGGVTDFALQGNWNDDAFLNTNVQPSAMDGSFDLWALEPWQTDLNSTAAGYGVPWI